MKLGPYYDPAYGIPSYGKYIDQQDEQANLSNQVRVKD